MEVVPFQSVGALRFGDPQAVARAAIASPFTCLTKAAPNAVDSYDELGLHLYYDRAGRLEFVEAFEPARVQFRGITFLGRSTNSVRTKMRKLGFAPTHVDEYGMKFGEVGIAITAPTGLVEGIAVHRRG